MADQGHRRRPRHTGALQVTHSRPPEVVRDPVRLPLHHLAARVLHLLAQARPSSTTWYAFHRSWIHRQWGAQAVEDPERLVVVQVEKRALGESMLPTIRPGAILVIDRGAGGRGVTDLREVRQGGIYLVRIDDGLTVKRVNVDGQALILSADNPDKRTFPSRHVPLRGTRVQDVLVGRVRWIGQEEE